MPLAGDSDGMISAFRGIPGGGGRQKPPAFAGAIADEILSDLNLGETSPLETIHENWESCVPPRLAGLGEPSDMGGTVLYVRTANSAAKQELAFEERRILAKLVKLAGCSRLRKIRFL